jgi:hypothetical protein
MKRREIQALSERLLARGISQLSADQPELQRDLKMAAGLILLLAKLPDVEFDVLPADHSAMRLPASH